MDIEDIHLLALQNNQKRYDDPVTGFTVFTEIAHLKRGVCCGNRCRHCPYGWENVRKKKNFVEDDAYRNDRPSPIVESGDKKAAQEMLQRIQIKYQKKATTGKNEDQAKDDTNPQKLKKNNNEKGRGGRYGGTLTEKNVPYTRKGDNGTAQLFTGERRRKDDNAFEAMGTVDELCSFVGVAHAELLANLRASKNDFENTKPQHNVEPKEEQIIERTNIDYGELPDWLLNIMSRLFDIGSHVAKPRKKVFDEDGNEEKDERPNFEANGVGDGFDMAHVEDLETQIDIMTEALPECGSFIMPTGGRASAHLHVARTVCRRAERLLVNLVEEGVCDPVAMQYMNRLSDFFFTASRWTNFCEGHDEILYKRYTKSAKQRHQVAVPLRK